MKKSTSIRMAILASVCVVALAACDDDDNDQTRDANTYQKQYASVEECMQDWDDAAQCESVPVVQNGVTIYMYNGPRFYWNTYNGVPRAMTVSGGRPMRATSSLTMATSGQARGSVSVSARTGSVASGSAKAGGSSSSAARGGFGSSASAGGHGGGGEGGGG